MGRNTRKKIQKVLGTNRKKKEPGIPSKCRDCGRESKQFRFDFYKAASCRCVACGGIIDPVEPILRRRTPN